MLEEKIYQHVNELDKWLKEVYGNDYPNFYGEQDISFDGWDGIEDTLALQFQTYSLEKASHKLLDAILFLISRSNEGGRIIAWLSVSPATQLSNIADLSYEDFMVLCRHAVHRTLNDDCDYQLVNCFRKFEVLTAEQIDLLLSFFYKKLQYQYVTYCLFLHQYENIQTLVTDWWKLGDDWQKLFCFQFVLEHFPNHQEISKFQHYLNQSKDSYLLNYLKEIVER